MSPRIKKAWLGLGGNLGDVQGAMANALQFLAADQDIAVVAVSCLYKTPPWGVEDQPWFFNCCAAVDTTLSPEQLLEVCQAAEREGKRERIIRWGPRTIDVDILIYEGVEQVEQRLTLPHPRMTERAFVLKPLADIAPDLLVKGQTITEHNAMINETDIEPIITPQNWWR